ncbi:SIMPL domain-containing protein [Paenibacillus sp. ACRRX]|uniref:SIMPL domain-containing protein n=1 Tax=Paenibacillus sp. ACRRX TaxID=2918206 RepID=UPI001EF5F585|nr:SIMPL domain-containing protein [Paenibacillus sp. ACRRX]MCG7408821.1 SIMPL domain-containing protein [Paenibacillus sp. ACRRX]
MHNWLKRTGVAMVVSGALVFGVLGVGNVTQSSIAYAASEQQRDLISVTGVGKLEVEPDIAYVNLGVVTKAVEASAAQELNATAFDKVKKALESYGVQAKDLKTVEFSVQPQYQYKDNEEPKIVSYQATHNVLVNYRDLTKLGKMVDAASKAGANRINQISFDVENKDSVETTVLEKAVAHAKKKAEALGKASGRTLDVVVNITESGYDYSPIRYQAEMMKMDSAPSSAPQGGQVKLQATVQVVYALK